MRTDNSRLTHVCETPSPMSEGFSALPAKSNLTNVSNFSGMNKGFRISDFFWQQFGQELHYIWIAVEKQLPYIAEASADVFEKTAKNLDFRHKFRSRATINI